LATLRNIKGLLPPRALLWARRTIRGHGQGKIDDPYHETRDCGKRKGRIAQVVWNHCDLLLSAGFNVASSGGSDEKTLRHLRGSQGST